MNAELLRVQALRDQVLATLSSQLSDIVRIAEFGPDGSDDDVLRVRMVMQAVSGMIYLSRAELDEVQP